MIYYIYYILKAVLQDTAKSMAEPGGRAPAQLR